MNDFSLEQPIDRLGHCRKTDRSQLPQTVLCNEWTGIATRVRNGVLGRTQVGVDVPPVQKRPGQNWLYPLIDATDPAELRSSLTETRRHPCCADRIWMPSGTKRRLSLQFRKRGDMGSQLIFAARLTKVSFGGHYSKKRL